MDPREASNHVGGVRRRRGLVKIYSMLPALLALSLAASACGVGPSTGSAPSTVAGIPETLWNEGQADPMRPIGLSAMQGIPAPAPRINSFQQGVDRIGGWRLLEIDDKEEHLVIEYSQGMDCEFGKGVLVAQTDSAVALVPLYETGPKPTPCNADLHLYVGSITLDKPLGDRKLIHLPGSNDAMEPPSKQPSP